MPSFIEKGGGPDAKKGLFLALFALSCGCDHYVEGICVEGSVDAEDVRGAISAVRNECSLSVNSELTIRFLQDAPDQDCGFLSGCTPIAGQYRTEEKTAYVWEKYERPIAVLRHELIHASLDLHGRDSDPGHVDTSLWCHANTVDSCEAKASTTDCWGD
jgi:hypothetical protein